MKIGHITADNFLRLNLFDVDLTGATVHLFAGANEAGKSSVQECIRFALLGESVRVGKTAAERALMIRDGAKAGAVTVNIDGADIKRDIKTGKETTGDYAAQLHPFLPYLLNAQRFAHEKTDARRAFLLKLTGTSVEPEDIARRMRAKGVDERCIPAVLPMLRSSMDAAHDLAASKASEARSQWVGLTGNARYGSQIASEWKPTAPEGYDPAALLAHEKTLAVIDEQIAGLNVSKGRAVAALDDARKAVGAKRPAPFKQKDLEKVLKAIDAESDTMEKRQARLNHLNAQYSNAVEQAPVTCWECGSLLWVTFRTEPGKGSIADCVPFTPLPEAELEKLRAKIIEAGNDVSDSRRSMESLVAERARLETSKAESGNAPKAVTQKDVAALEEVLADIESKITDTREQSAALNEKLATLRVAATRLRDAKTIEDRAQSLHRGVQAWTLCANALAADGIQAEILSDTLTPVNKRLRETSITTGWPQVSIDPTMEIVVDGRRYSLLSESAKWRADAAIADAIAHLSGLRMLLLDRIDCLDLPNRGALMHWMNEVMGDYDSVLLFGTLKSLPKLPEGMAAYWVENGELKEAD